MINKIFHKQTNEYTTNIKNIKGEVTIVNRDITIRKGENNNEIK